MQAATERTNAKLCELIEEVRRQNTLLTEMIRVNQRQEDASDRLAEVQEKIVERLSHLAGYNIVPNYHN